MYAEDLDECPECEEAGLISAIYRVGVKSSNEHPIETFRAKNKERTIHKHDSLNEYLYTYRCSLGHVTQHQYTGRSCWCGWLPPEQQEVVDAERMEEEFGIITTDTFGEWE